MTYKIYDEILEQPEVLRKTLEHEINNMDDLSNIVKKADKIYLIGSGSSISSCYSIRDALRMTSSINIETYIGYEFYFNKKLIMNENSIAIFASQSGETHDTINALKKAKKFNIKTISISNEKNSSISNASDYQIVTRCGTEIGILGTKTHLTQLFCLYYLLFKASDYENADIILNNLKKMPDILEDLINETEEKCKNLAYTYKDETFFYCLGVGPNFGLAYKVAMTVLMEGSNVNACPEYSAEFRHGLIECVNKDTPMIILSADYGADIITQKAIDFLKYIDNKKIIHFKLQNYININKLLSPFILLIPLEWFGYYLAYHNGIDAGTARHLGILPYDESI